MKNINSSPGLGPLPKGKAKEKYDRFKKSFPDTKFPATVCYTIDDLRKYLNDAETSLINNNIPTDQRGIALVLGLNDNDGTYAADKITIMLVATAFKDDGNCKVLTIDNPVTEKQTYSKKKLKVGKDDVDDICYDFGNIFP